MGADTAGPGPVLTVRQRCQRTVRVSHAILPASRPASRNARAREILVAPPGGGFRAGAARIAALLTCCALLSLLLWDRPDFLISSDSLFPAAFVWDAMHRGDAWSGLQQPHIPSFFPDLLIHGTAQMATGRWRAALAVWVFVVLVWLAVLLIRLTAQVAGVGREAVAPWVLLLFMLVFTRAALGLNGFTAADGGGDPFLPFLFILLPYTHGGPFLLALTGALIARETAARPSGLKLLTLALLSGAMGVSDQLCLFSFVGPLTAALLGGWLTNTVARQTALYILSAVWGGNALGALYAYTLDVQYMPLPSLTTMLSHTAGFVADLGRHPFMLILLAGLLSAFAGTVWRHGLGIPLESVARVPPKDRHPPAEPEDDGLHRFGPPQLSGQMRVSGQMRGGFLGDFWSVFAASGTLGSIALMMLFHEDVWSYRYALPALWWAFILTAAALSWHGRRVLLAPRLAASALAVCLALPWAAAGFPAPRLSHWGSPLAACLENTAMRAGLADFWIARKTSAASDWRLQIEPIDSIGEARVWGNNRKWFTHDIHDASRRPDYRFIVMDRLPRDQIAQVYGQPDRVVMCGASSVWVYDEPGRLYRALERMSPFLADVFAAAPP